MIAEADDLAILEDVDAVRRWGLRAFTELAWPILEPATPFIRNWHLDTMAEFLTSVWKCERNDLLINMPPRHALRLGTLIPTMRGMVPVESVKVGDEVFGPDGQRTCVSGKSDIFVNRKIYRVWTDDNAYLDVDGEHLWTVRLDRKRDLYRTYTTEQIFARQSGALVRRLRGGDVEIRAEQVCTERRLPRLPDYEPVQYAAVELPLDPYILGVWLGDGHCGHAVVTMADDDAVIVRAEIQRRGVRTSTQTARYRFGLLGIRPALKAIGVLQRKHIPEQYMTASVQQRRDLLKGLMDTDGNVSVKGQCFFSQSNEAFARQVLQLVRSLGVKASICQVPAYLNGERHKDSWRVCFYASDIACLPRKEERTLRGKRSFGRYIRIEDLGITDSTQCLTIEREDGLFQAGDGYIVTHNCKSIMLAVMFPAYVWTVEPSLRWLYSSYAQSLSIRDSVKMRRLIESPWYRERWGHVFELTSDQNQKLKFENDRSGYRMATSVGGSNTGEGGDILVVDDPHNVEERESDVMREGAIDWWSNVMSTRINDPRKRRRIVVMQRVHEHDLAGHLLDQGGWHHLNLPAEYEGGKCIVTGCVFHWDKDPRTVDGEPLWKDRYGAAEIQQLKKDLKEYGAAAQLQQRPAPAEGGILKRHWWKYWCYPGQEDTLPPVRVKQLDGTYLEVKPIPLPYVFDKEVQSWDMAFKDLTESSYVVGQQWGRRGPDSFCKDQVRGQYDFVGTLAAVRAFNGTHRQPSTKVIEDKANGPAIISVMKGELPGIIPHGVLGDKQARAAAYSHIPHGGNCYLPHPSIAPWVDGFINECATFPNGSYDDQVDTWSQAMDVLYKVEENGVAITPQYSVQFHQAAKGLEPVPGAPSFRFWYQGLYPCCIVGQTLSSGRILLLDCVLGEQSTTVEQLIQNKVMPLLAADYRGCTEWRDITNHGPVSARMDPHEHQLDQIIAKLLEGSPEPGELDFFTRLNAIVGLLSQTGRLTTNPAPTPGEPKPWIHEALSGGYAYRKDQSGVISKSEARKHHPLTSVGEALGHGLTRIFVKKAAPPPRSNRKDAQRRANSYAV